MSFGISAAAWTAIAAGAYVANSYVQGEEAKKRQESAQNLAMQQAKATADKADQEFNRVNGKKPNLLGIMDANATAAKGGVSGTMLTGPLGIDPVMLQLGKNTLLGS